MGRQLTGLEGTITSWGSGASDWHNHLVSTGTAPTNVTVNVSAPEFDTTSIGGASANRSYRSMLGSWTVSGESIWKRATPYIGAQGLVTFASGGYTQHVKSWNLSASWDALDVTEFNASGVLWRSFRPAFRGKFTGSYQGYVDDGTALAGPQLWTGSPLSATFKLSEDGLNDNAFGLSIVATQTNFGMPIQSGQLDTYQYSYVGTGALTCFSKTGDGTTTFGENVLPGSQAGYVLDIPPYDNAGNGTPNKTMLITLASGRTLSGFAFLTNVNITCDVDQPIKVSWTAQGTGALAFA